MASTGQAVHRVMVLVDIEGFGAPDRTLPHQLGTRQGLYAVMAEALQAAGVPWAVCYHEDRGDGAVVLVPPQYPKAPLVEVLPEALVRALRAHNHTSHHFQRARLRLAVHAGEVAFDQHGVTSTSLTAAFRLLDAAPLKKALADSPGLVAMIVSRLIFDDVVHHSAVLDPTVFRPVPVNVKEVRDIAWIALPDHPYPSDATVLERSARHDTFRTVIDGAAGAPERKKRATWHRKCAFLIFGLIGALGVGEIVNHNKWKSTLAVLEIGTGPSAVTGTFFFAGSLALLAFLATANTKGTFGGIGRAVAAGILIGATVFPIVVSAIAGGTQILRTQMPPVAALVVSTFVISAGFLLALGWLEDRGETEPVSSGSSAH